MKSKTTSPSRRRCRRGAEKPGNSPRVLCSVGGREVAGGICLGQIAKGSMLIICVCFWRKYEKQKATKMLRLRH